ncbi:MAG: primosomal protein N', partial [Elusimicrobia bacterium]|nr:primosomal protein N' [Elusimicrobiota bacterium]
THVECRACGWVAQCPACHVSLVLHREKAGPFLHCHTCDHREPLSEKCPKCRGEVLKMSGRGTQRVAADLTALFPSARLFRWDRDAVRGRQGHEQAYRDALSGKIDIIVGTQMIAQGHDFPNLTLVGVLDADRSLSFPDFRAAERTFQLLMQVAGRAGRSDRPGEVIIQTSSPDHYALQAVLERNYESFAQHELSYRREAAYPPFTRVVHAVVRARAESGAESAAEQFVRWMQSHVPAVEGDVLGPAPAFHRMKAGWAQWQAVIKAPLSAMDHWIRLARSFTPPAGTTLHLDVDPETMA